MTDAPFQLKFLPVTDKKHSRNEPVSRSGRFDSGPGKDVTAFTESVRFDQRLWKQDILGSIAHANMLARIGVLAEEERAAIASGLEEIGREIAEGSFAWRDDLEDVHMNIEAELTRRIPAGAKLHTARSRNDQIALDIRMWLRDEIVALIGELRALQRSLVQLGEDHSHVIIPGYTHLQRAQPVYFAHHLLAYEEMFQRDYERLVDAFKRVNVCPLGAGALAGSTLPLDREGVASELGFVDTHGRPQITQNSMDAVSDRDFAVEFCSVAALLAIHLSRLAEDVILWSSTEFQFIRIDDTYTTGSSLMPQKKNPDIAELARGKSGRMIGNLVSLLTLLKGLPMTYNRDLQEDKEPLFDSVDTIRATVRLVAAMMSHTTVLEENCSRAASDPSLIATDLADYLVRKGVPFRNAHHAVGRIVALAERKSQPLNRLTLDEYHSVEARFENDVYDLFSLEKALDQRDITGAPSQRQVLNQLKTWRKLLDQETKEPTP